jgi:hypothetical protein
MLLAPEEVDAVRIANDIVQSGAEDGPGMAVTIHTSGVPDHGREPVLRGSGIIRTARVFADHTTAGVFGTKDGTY